MKVSSLHWKNPQITKFARFIVAGGVNTGVFYGFYLLLIYFGVNYNLALIIDYSGGIVAGFLLNKHWTFSANHGGNRSLSRYIMVYALVFLVNFALLNLFVVSGFLDPYLGQLLALVCVVGLSFILQNFWVFNKT